MLVPIKGWEGEYFINEAGGVWSAKTRKWKAWHDKNGYARVGLSRCHKNHNYQVGRLVALTFIPNPEGKPEVNHKDGNKWNNCVSNLEWATQAENWNHAKHILHVTSGDHAPRGENASGAKLTRLQVIEIVRRLKTGESVPAIAKFYQLTKPTIYYIKIGKTWKDVPR